MAIIQRTERGDPIRARNLNAMRDTARVAVSPTVGRGLETRITPHGVSFSTVPTAEQIADAVKAELTSVTAVDIYNVVEVYEAQEGYTGPVLMLCRQPSESGFARLGITLGGATQNRCPWVQTGIGSICPVAYSGTVVVGGRLGGKRGSYLAQPDQGGPFLVRQLPAAGIALVEITGKRLDSKMVNCNTLDVTLSGPYHTIIYKGRVVTVNSPGKLTTI